jgi:hypothetical protein
MKIILVIQSLIILAGAYYIYTLSHETVEQDEVVTKVVPAPTSTPAAVEIEATTTVETKTNAPVPSAGPNDAGMEWPVFEGDLEVR